MDVYLHGGQVLDTLPYRFLSPVLPVQVSVINIDCCHSFHQPPGLLSFLSLFLSFSCSPNLAWYIRKWLKVVWLLCMDTLLAFMEFADDFGSRPASWINIPVQSYFCSLCVNYMTLVVKKDTYRTANIVIIIIGS